MNSRKYNTIQYNTIPPRNDIADCPTVGGQTLSGTTRDQCWGQKEPFEPKKIWPRPAFDGLEAAGGS